MSVATDRQPAATIAPRRKRKPVLPYWLLVPAIAILVIGTGYPTAWQLFNSFREYGLAQQFGKPAPWIWFQNYTELLSDSQFWAVVLRSLVFCAVTAGATLIIGLGIALLMAAVGRTVRIMLQVSMLLAWAMPVVAAMTVWTWLFDRRRGVINYTLDKIPGVDMYRFNWLAEPLTFFFVASVIVIWMSVPFVAFSLYAGLTQVSEEVLEAADLDGASGSQRLRLVILPIIRPVMSIVLLLQIIWDLRVFTQITILQDAGSSASEFDLLGTYIYKLGTGSQHFGMAAAASVVVLIITLVVSGGYVWRIMKEDSK
ncbi:carbohydrate ABC transporter permease [Demequina sp.]|uniref:carbohydrate ABC transporter permease n=1 Tax=Demequina sp. TaxID=2050685 RepID=UPI003D0FF092